MAGSFRYLLLTITNLPTSSGVVCSQEHHTTCRLPFSARGNTWWPSVTADEIEKECLERLQPLTLKRLFSIKDTFYKRRKLVIQSNVYE